MIDANKLLERLELLKSISTSPFEEVAIDWAIALIKNEIKIQNRGSDSK